MQKPPTLQSRVEKALPPITAWAGEVTRKCRLCEAGSWVTATPAITDLLYARAPAALAGLADESFALATIFRRRDIRLTRSTIDWSRPAFFNSPRKSGDWLPITMVFECARNSSKSVVSILWMCGIERRM